MSVGCWLKIGRWPSYTCVMIQSCFTFFTCFKRQQLFFCLCVIGCRLFLHTIVNAHLFVISLLAPRSRAINDVVGAIFRTYTLIMWICGSYPLLRQAITLPMNRGCCMVVVAIIIQLHWFVSRNDSREYLPKKHMSNNEQKHIWRICFLRTRFSGRLCCFWFVNVILSLTIRVWKNPRLESSSARNI